MRVIVDTSESLDFRKEPKERFGDWSESWSFDVEGVREADEDAPTPYGSEGHRLPDGSTHAHVLWMRYSTGDSFGRADGKGEIIGVFADRKVAEEALKAFDRNKNEYSIEITDDFGRKIKLHNSAAGYFESLESLNLDTFSLDEAPIRIRY